MPEYHVAPLENLVDKFESLQGIGHKSAQRAAYQVLNMPIEEAESFAKAILDALPTVQTVGAAARESIPIPWDRLMGQVEQRYAALVQRKGKGGLA